MIRDDDHFRALAERFNAAALGGSWGHALEGLAEAVGAPHGQLIGVGSPAAVPFNWITRLDPEALLEWLDLDGPDPRANARVRVGLTSRELEVANDAEFATEDDLRSPVYQLYRRHGLNHGCQTTLVRQADFVVGLAVLQGDRQGPVQADGRRAFAALAGHARAAVGLQLALEAQAPALVAAAFEAVSSAAFICDPGGVVRAMTPGADALVAEQRFLSLSHGRLQALNPLDEARLGRALRASAAAPWPLPPQDQELTVHSADRLERLQLQVAPLPKRDHAFRFHAATLVLARPPRARVQRGRQLQAEFGLTPAEAEIALALAGGDTVRDIAARRLVTVATVRTQLKTIFGKLGVRRQAELAARLNAL